MPFSKKILCLSLYSSLILLQGCSTPLGVVLQPYSTGPTQNQIDDDAALSQKLQDSVHTQYPTEGLMVVSNHFNVLVVGQYSNSAAKSEIDELIQKQPGVKSVKDYATLQSKPRLNINKDLQQKAQARITEEQNISEENLQVIAVDNVVYVTGIINIAEQHNLDEAILGISVIDGVLKVVNLVQVKETTMP